MVGGQEDMIVDVALDLRTTNNIDCRERAFCMPIPARLRMRRERLIRPTDGVRICRSVRRVSVASGICARLPDAA